MVGLELPGQGARWRAVTTPAHAAPGTYAHFKTFPGRGTLGRHGPKAQPQAICPPGFSCPWPGSQEHQGFKTIFSS